ncbi:MAG: response regulator, partial [Vicinamibacteria bacterium]
MSLEVKRKVLIVDDHPIVRQGLTQLISQESDLEVVGEADNSRTAIEAVQRLSSDVVIVD